MKFRKTYRHQLLPHCGFYWGPEGFHDQGLVGVLCKAVLGDPELQPFLTVKAVELLVAINGALLLLGGQHRGHLAFEDASQLHQDFGEYPSRTDEFNHTVTVYNREPHPNIELRFERSVRLETGRLTGN